MLFAEGQTVGDAKVFGGAGGSVPLVGAAKSRSSVMVPEKRQRRIDRAHRLYAGRCGRRCEKGQKIGVLKVWRGDNIALEVPLDAAETVDAGSMPRRAIDARDANS